MPVNDALGQRMKYNYEEVSKTRLVRRTPVAIRIDGKAFHTFTKGFSKPFDTILVESMQETMKYLCENIQGCVFGYTQSDEITLILIDYQNLDTAAWFDYEVQKICSISASMATLAFNRIFSNKVKDFESISDNIKIANSKEDVDSNIKYIQYASTLDKAVSRGAMFDSRCFNIPKEEVGNLIYWRQVDATRNSIQMVGQANFSHKELQGLSCNKIQDKLFTEKNINWNDFPVYLKRGTTCYKDPIDGWTIDLNMPILKDDWDYINKYILVGVN